MDLEAAASSEVTALHPPTAGLWGSKGNASEWVALSEEL